MITIYRIINQSVHISNFVIALYVIIIFIWCKICLWWVRTSSVTTTTSGV